MGISPLRKKYLADVLIANNLVTKEQLEKAVAEQQETKEQLGAILVKRGFLTESSLLEAMAIFHGLPLVKSSELKSEKDVLKIIPEKMLRRFNVLPLSKKDNVLKIAIADPSNVVAIDEIESSTGLKLSLVLASEKEIKEILERSFTAEILSSDAVLGETIQDITNEETEQSESDDYDAAPVIKYVNSLLYEAVTKKASDIHIEPEEAGVSLRMRIDGKLHESPPPPHKYFSAIVSRIKIIANLDIAERRLPQDGKCKIKIGEKKVDVRVSTLPTIYGEKIVMRVLDRSSLSLQLSDMGFEVRDAEKFKEALDKPYGMILVTGPTGSGKTTTLYTGLYYVNKPDKNIVTVEDPVEYELKKVNQVQVRPQIGLTFASILRSVLRQDPDIIMVGEIRDKETAEIAIQAALTGHLVLSTLHTNDAISALSRLRYMGIEPFLIADAVDLVIAQRLMRKICPSCKTEQTVPEAIYEKLGLPKDNKIMLYYGKGCEKCFDSGYKGRTAITEILPLTTEIKKMIIAETGDIAIKELALKNGMQTLRDKAIEKLLAGVTTVEEVLSVTSAQS